MVKVLAGYLGKGSRKESLAAALYDSVTMTAFGPVITVEGGSPTMEELLDLGEEFIDFVEKESGDVRTVLNDELHALLVRFLQTREDKEEKGEAP
jgi:hypothetical protein